MSGQARTPKPHKPLHDRGVVVTRPAAQADGMCAAIEQAGGRPWRFPAIEIQPSDSADDQARLQQIEQYDLLIYISSNAVRFGPPSTQPKTLLAVGKATQEALASLGLYTSETPASPYNSEALLALPSLQNINSQRILIVRGKGGRELLAETLRERGAEVEYAQVYRRARPEQDESALMAEWVRGGIHVVTVTSVETLENLMKLLSPPAQAMLRSTPLVAASERVLQKAHELGFRLPVTVAANPGDKAMTEAAIHALNHLPD